MSRFDSTRQTIYDAQTPAVRQAIDELETRGLYWGISFGTANAVGVLRELNGECTYCGVKLFDNGERIPGVQCLCDVMPDHQERDAALLSAFAAILRHDGVDTARDHVANAAVLAVKAWMQMEEGK